MSRNRWIFLAAAVVAVIFVGAYAASPFWAAQQLGTAFRTGDKDALTAAIDFPSVRDSLKSSLNVTFAKKMADDPSIKNNPFTGLGVMFVPVIIDKLMDSYVTPDAFAAISQNKINRGDSSNSTSPFASTAKGKFRTRYVSLDRFDIMSTNDPKGQIDFVMKRIGLFGWRVERIELPDALFNPDTSKTADSSDITTTTADQANANATAAAPDDHGPAAPFGYPYDLPKRYPKAFAAWRSEVPENLRDEPFVANLDGVTDVIRAVTMDGRDMLFGSVCKPHECGPNDMGILFAPDQSEIVGVLYVTDDDKRVPIEIGPITAVEKSCIKKLIDDNSATNCDGVPEAGAGYAG